MVVGAGQSGTVILKEMLTSQYTDGTVVCFVDDDPNKVGKILNGVPVAGSRNDIPELVKKYKIHEIYIAMPSASAKDRKEIIEICRETLSSLVDLYISNNDLRMNNIMKRLTIVSTIFIPLTFLAGVWGMNYKWMPELDWRYGYLFAWLVMGIIGIIVYLFFKKKNWY